MDGFKKTPQKPWAASLIFSRPSLDPSCMHMCSPLPPSVRMKSRHLVHFTINHAPLQILQETQPSLRASSSTFNLHVPFFIAVLKSTNLEIIHLHRNCVRYQRNTLLFFVIICRKCHDCISFQIHNQLRIINDTSQKLHCGKISCKKKIGRASCRERVLRLV